MARKTRISSHSQSVCGVFMLCIFAQQADTPQRSLPAIPFPHRRVLFCRGLNSRLPGTFLGSRSPPERVSEKFERILQSVITPEKLLTRYNRGRAENAELRRSLRLAT